MVQVALYCSPSIWNRKGGVPPGPTLRDGNNDRIRLLPTPAAKPRTFCSIAFPLKPILPKARVACIALLIHPRVVAFVPTGNSIEPPAPFGPKFINTVCVSFQPNAADPIVITASATAKAITNHLLVTTLAIPLKTFFRKLKNPSPLGSLLLTGSFSQ